MNFSIIIPTYNRVRLLHKTLCNIKNLQYPYHKFEVIVVDNRSTDGTHTTIESFSKTNPDLHIRYAYEERQGRSFASNTGLRIAKYRVAIFLDDDILINPDLLIIFNEVFTNYPNAFIVGGIITAVSDNKFHNILEKITIDDMWTMGQVNWGTKRRYLKYPDTLFSGCLAIRINKKDQLKGVFDELLGVRYKNIYLYGEDYELCLRSELEGKKIVFEPKIFSRNIIENNRLNKLYILKRYFVAGIERYVIDKKLQKSFPHHKAYVFPWSYAAKCLFKNIVYPSATPKYSLKDICYALGYNIFGKAYLNRTAVSLILEFI